MDRATLEEFNRQREAMGMKPLPVEGQEAAGGGDSDEDEDPNATLAGRHAQAYDNFKAVQEAEQAKRDREQRAEAVKRAREKAQRNALLAGSTLGEAEGGEGDVDVDAKAWLRGQKKRQKKIEKLSQKEREEAEAEEQKRKKDNDDNDDDAGVKVGHDMATLLGGEDQILTLKDSTVLENEDEGDELENIGLREQEQLEDRLNLKKKRPTYDPLAMDDDGTRPAVLAQYDEEIYGKKHKSFVLDPKLILGDDSSSSINNSSNGASRQPSDAIGGRVGAAPIRRYQDYVGMDDILTGGPSSDYIDASEIKVKKPKKKSKKEKRKIRQRDEEDVLFPVENGGESTVDGTEMEVDGDATSAKKRKRKAAEDDGDIFDNEDLQAMMATQRKTALRKRMEERKKLRPEELARQLREEREQPESNTSGDAVGLVIDETAEFVSNIQKPKKIKGEDENEDQDHSDVSMKDEGEDDEDPGRGDHDGYDSDAVAAAEAALAEAEAAEAAEAGLEEEKKIGQGMGATLSILKERGIIDADGTGAELNDRMRKHEQFVAEKRVLLTRLEEEARRQREIDRTSGPMARMTTREREEYARKQNKQRDHQTSRMLQDLFNKHYTPNFKLDRVDEHGRVLNQKEAFRELSHGFHGKTSGRGKTDKMLKKIEAEKRRMAEGILDVSQSVGMSSATAQQLKKRKEAGVRLD